MLKKGIPVVYAYIADAHDNQEGATLSAETTFGPGEAPYVKQLADYNAAFGTFFANLKAAGIDQSNTLFIFTPDEGDHFVGGAPSPANCDGAKIVDGVVTPDVPCTYGTNGVGELDLNLNGVVAAAGETTPFSIHFNDAATTYVTGQPGPTESSVRQLERTMAGLSAVNPHTGLSESLIGTGLGPDLQGALADPIAQKLIHMNTVADPNREPTFTFFGNPNFFFETAASTVNLTPMVGTGFARNHGDIQDDIARTFIGIVDPGVKHLGVTLPPRDSFSEHDKRDHDDGDHDNWMHDDHDDAQRFFTDHVDLRPTMMFLLGLKDDYRHYGRVILEGNWIIPHLLRVDGTLLYVHFPIQAARFHHQEELARILGYVANAVPGAMVIDGYHDKPPADHAVHDHAESSPLRGRLIARSPLDTPLSGSDVERIGLIVCVAGP